MFSNEVNLIRFNLEVSIVALFVGHGDVELVEGESDSFEVLFVLHPVDEVPADDVCLKI